MARPARRSILPPRCRPSGIGRQQPGPRSRCGRRDFRNRQGHGPGLQPVGQLRTRLARRPDLADTRRRHRCAQPDLFGRFRRRPADLHRQCRRRDRNRPDRRRLGRHALEGAVARLHRQAALLFPVVAAGRAGHLADGRRRRCPADPVAPPPRQRSAARSRPTAHASFMSTAASRSAASTPMSCWATASPRCARSTGTLSTGGTVSASGTVGIDPSGGFPANLAIKIVKGRYADGRVVAATLDGDLTVTGSLLSGPVVAGTIDLDRTVIHRARQAARFACGTRRQAQECERRRARAGPGDESAERDVVRRLGRASASTSRSTPTPDLRAGQGSRRRTRRQPAHHRLDWLAPGRRPVHADARSPVHHRPPA